jgi:hypothetical protein
LPPAAAAAPVRGAWPGLPGALLTPGILPGIPGSSALAGVADLTLRMVRTAVGVMSEVVPAGGQTEWRELQNKLHAFEWFTFAGRRLGAVAGEPVSVARQAPRAAGLADGYTGLWAMEGLGYAGARAAGTVAWPPRGQFAGDRAGGLPARAEVPLSTGSALAMAECLLADLERGEGPDQDLVARWFERCRDGRRPGFGELAVEALGLVARTLDPCRLERLDELLAAVGPTLTEYLWHGAGRGLYFAPMQLAPWSGACRRAFAKARGEPPRDSGRRNAVAGLAWAVTLVNVRSPEVAATSLAGCDEDPGVEEAIANGAASALLVWRQWAGEDPLLARFLAHQPPDAERARRWRRRVLGPCRAALAGSGRDLGRGDEIAGLFRFQVPS